MTRLPRGRAGGRGGASKNPQRGALPLPPVTALPASRPVPRPPSPSPSPRLPLYLALTGAGFARSIVRPGPPPLLIITPRWTSGRPGGGGVRVNGWVRVTLSLPEAARARPPPPHIRVSLGRSAGPAKRVWSQVLNAAFRRRRGRAGARQVPGRRARQEPRARGDEAGRSTATCHPGAQSGRRSPAR